MNCSNCRVALLPIDVKYPQVKGGFLCEKCHADLNGYVKTPPAGYAYHLEAVKSDPVNSPSHYKTGGIETIDFLEAKLGEGFEDYCAGNILKYLTRYKHKNGLEDLKKAKWYLEKVITWKEKHDPPTSN